MVVAGHGRHVWVETNDGKRLICHPRGKKSQTVVGDRVLWQATEDEGTVEKVEPRRNLFYRQDEIRTKAFAANLDQILILIAAEPEFSETQLSRALIAAEAEQIKVIIALNKSDLKAPFDLAWDRLGPYRDMGYTMLPLALKPRTNSELSGSNELTTLMPLLNGRTTLVLGPSGAGKSTLINRLVPEARVLTNEISTALNTGKHTTTSTNLYWSDTARTTAVIDSPGFQEFGLNHIDAMHLAGLMPDIKVHASECKFYNCTHLHEPGCGVISELKKADGTSGISARRYKIYSDLFTELTQKRY
ncbi:ribosome small subunit-dependent GTPase A [Rhodoferax aquaticus]|uniref:Small ribosomal subunit biogenesis GTPase RsgA n=1 Tax=Rhodoferax aquaticus TaxID=2527691 RepID=A0A515EVW5_9BURK|nr:ribosome small subunit-dependent GTPase A [Rhodoferax aquaticus]